MTIRVKIFFYTPACVCVLLGTRTGKVKCNFTCINCGAEMENVMRKDRSYYNETRKRTAILAAGMTVLLMLTGCSAAKNAGTVQETASDSKQLEETSDNTKAATEMAGSISETTVTSFEKKETVSVTSATSGNALITAAEAEEAAFSHAGVKREDILYIRSKLDFEDRALVYEVEFFTDGKEYDYDILADTGEIKSFDYEIEYAKLENGSLVESTPAGQNGITKAEAEEAALNHAGVKREEVLYIKAELDYDDGQLIYEVEFYTDGKEYDYDILASNGEVRKFDYEIEYADWRNGAAAETGRVDAQVGSITLEEAKELVAAQIPGVDTAAIRIKEDFDDGRLIYEGEVIHNQMEYEFEIDAKTGAIIDWDVESIFD